MERRCEARLAVSLQALLYQADTKPMVCQVVNLGVNGAFIKVKSVASLPATVVDIVLPIEAFGMPRRRRLRAVVVHTTADGAGVRFLDSCADVLRAVTSLSRWYAMPGARSGMRSEAGPAERVLH